MGFSLGPEGGGSVLLGWGGGLSTGGEGGERGSGCWRLVRNQPRGLSPAKGCGGAGRPGSGGRRAAAAEGAGGAPHTDPRATPEGAGAAGGGVGGGGGEADRGRRGPCRAGRGGGGGLRAPPGRSEMKGQARLRLRRRCPRREQQSTGLKCIRSSARGHPLRSHTHTHTHIHTHPLTRLTLPCS